MGDSRGLTQGNVGEKTESQLEPGETERGREGEFVIKLRPKLSKLPYSQKIWRGIKFGSLAVYVTTAKLKSAKISKSHIYMYIYVW